jgi:hypothetical protein
MRLSVLIASTPTRWEMTNKLYGNLLSMVGDKEIEILLFMDNHKRSIGHKRQALMEIAKGDFMLWCDSDDEILSLDEIYEATAQDVDVIDYKALCRNNDGSTFIVTQKLGYEITHESNGRGGYADMNRPPFQNCAWNKKFKKFSFPDSSYGEDYHWLEQCYKEAKTEVFIDKIIYKYNFDEKISEAPAPTV